MKVLECIPNFSEGRDEGKITTVLEFIRNEIAGRGLEIAECEVVGLLPLEALVGVVRE